MSSRRDINPSLLTKMSSFLKAFVESTSKMESWSKTSRLRIMIDNIGNRFASFAAAWRVNSIFLEKGSMELRAIYEAPDLANE